MSIRTKLALTLFVTVALFLGMEQFVRRASFFASFAELEQAHAEQEIGRTRTAFENLAEELTLRADRMVTDESGESDDLLPLEVHMRLVIDEAGDVHQHRITNPGTGHVMRIREFPSERLSPGHPVPLAWLSDGAPSGLIATHSGPMLIGSAELDVGDRPGLLVLGRMLDADLLARMREIADSQFEFELVDSPNLSNEDRKVFEDVTAFDGARVQEGSDGTMVAYATIRDIRGLPIALVRTPVAGGELALWGELERYQLLTSAAIAAIFPLILLVLIQFMIVGPLSRLSRQAEEIGSSDDSSLRLGLTRTDEIGKLARRFDQMLEKLERSRIDQQRTARFAGRSEVAVGVMHNVGNLANSLGVSAGMARDRFTCLDTGDLRRVLDELAAHEGHVDEYLRSDSRGKHLMEFFGAIVDRLEADVAAAREESGAVLDQVRRITELVQALDASKSEIEVVERIELPQEIEAALRLALSSTGVEVEVVQEFDGVPPFVVDRQRLHELLVAVFTNAIEAMAETPLPERFLVISTERPTPEVVRVHVRDFGVGIEPSKSKRIFAAGFSSKPGGSGFGLHLAALAATEMGGELTVESDGSGTGATFTLELPLEVSPRADASGEADRPAA